MEVAVKPEAINGNGTPLPQRKIQQNAGGPLAQQQQVPQQNSDGSAEKKPRFDGQNRGGGNQLNKNRQNRFQQNNQNRQNNPQNNRMGMNMNQNRQNQNQQIKNEKGDGIPNLMDNKIDNMGPGGGNRQQNRGGGNQNNRRRDDDRRGGGGGSGKGDDYLINLKLKNLGGSTHELPPIEQEETKFSGRNRLYIGNLTNDITEDELRELFKPFGEIAEPFINAEKNFAFLKVDFHTSAERAKRELDGSMRKNRTLRVRFAPNATIVRVKNLTAFISNELLYKAFEIFGPIERAVIIVDDRGKPTGEGIVEFARKAGANAAMRSCNDKCFFLTSSLRPCVVEPFELNDDTDGLPDKSINKKTQDFYKARQLGPRFAEIGSFEHEYGTRWKQLHELFKQKHEALKRELQMEEEKLEAQMEFARYEHETELLRQQLRQREQDKDRQKMQWELKERQCEELRTRESDQMRRQQEDMQMRINRQDEEMRRRQQENTLFMQAQQLSSLLDASEGIGQNSPMEGGNMHNNSFNQGQNRMGNRGNNGNNFGGDFGGNNMGNMGGGNMGNQDQGFLNNFGNPNQQNQGQGGNNQRGNMNRWNDRRGGGGNDDFQNKRRRF